MRIYLDTNIIIYFIQKSPIWGPRAAARLAALHAAGASPVVSDLTRNPPPLGFKGIPMDKSSQRGRPRKPRPPGLSGELGDAIEQRRKELGWTADELGARAGLGWAR